MTRIIAGEFGGRRLSVPRGRGTRPTPDRVREAWMSIVAPGLPGATVLDLFAGTGALGLEALSRGARSVVFVERSPAALEQLRKNIELLGVAGRCRVVRADATHFASELGPGAYDVAFADPPYDTEDAARLAALFRQVPFAAVLGVEHTPQKSLGGDDSRRYGDTALTFFHAP